MTEFLFGLLAGIIGGFVLFPVVVATWCWWVER